MTNYTLDYTIEATITVERNEQYAFQAKNDAEARKKAEAHMKRMEGEDGCSFVLDGVVGLSGVESDDVEVSDVYPNALYNEDENEEIDYEDD